MFRHSTVPHKNIKPILYISVPLCSALNYQPKTNYCDVITKKGYLFRFIRILPNKGFGRNAETNTNYPIDLLHHCTRTTRLIRFIRSIPITTIEFRRKYNNQRQGTLRKQQWMIIVCTSSPSAGEKKQLIEKFWFCKFDPTKS